MKNRHSIVKSNVRPDAETRRGIARFLLGTLLAYLAFILAFRFLAGDQLIYRDSRGSLETPAADAVTVELTEGSSVEQRFSVKIERLEAVYAQWGTFGRQNTGTLTMELLLAPEKGAEGAEETVLARTEYDVAQLAEQQYLELRPEEPIEGIFGVPLLLRITADSPEGAAGTPLACTDPDMLAAWERMLAKNESRFKSPDGDGEPRFALRVDGETAPGMLRFAAHGTDYIWAGTHYWQFSLCLGAAIALFFLTAWLRYRAGRRSYVISCVLALQKYRFLIRQLVSRDFKTRYKRSIFGMLWSILNPLLTMLVQYFVFSSIFRNDIPHFAAYLIIGVVMFNFFAEAASLSLTSIIGNAGLITKVYMPKYIYPLTRTLSSLVNLSLSLIPLVVICAATGIELKKSAVLALYFFACLVIFALGFGMLLATSMVFFRDTQFLWSVLTMMWMYATPIFYPETILPDNFKTVLRLNPIYYFLRNARLCILNGISPEPFEYFRCLAISLAMLAVGAFVFWRHQNKFVLYL